MEAAEGRIVKFESQKITILQWLGNALRQLLVRVPYNKIRGHFGFTCSKCIQRGRRELVKQSFPFSSMFPDYRPWDRERYWDKRINTQYLPVRCKSCNTKHARYKRARRAMEKIFRKLAGNQRCWFITLTRENRIFEAGDVVDLEKDREQWIADFKQFRNRKAWKNTFAGGYWFYEYTLHYPGEKIFDRKGCFVRECKNFELNGHLHILATASPRIPMKQLAESWGGRIDMRKNDRKSGFPLTEEVVLRYLRGYLTKTDMPGAVNMRPFGNMVSR